MRDLRRGTVAMLLLIVAFVATEAAPPRATASPARPAGPALEHLDPGGEVELVLDVPINVVYVGIEEGEGPLEVMPEWVLENQPEKHRPIEWRAFKESGRQEGEIGLEYRYDVEQVFADAAFEDAFFGYLAQRADGPFRPTPVQARYSAHPLAAATVAENYVLDATEVESWLIEQAPDRLGVDTARPTVFFINWYGRPDFRFHTYAPYTYQPELDRFAPDWTLNHTIAWGGGVPDATQSPTSSLGRVWFLDVSAGPDAWTANYRLDVGDLTGDGYPDRRLPPAWEYGTDHWYAPFPTVGADLSLVLRYVAINLLFTPGPLYDVGISAPLLDEALELDINVFEERPNGRADSLVVGEALRRFRALDPSRSFSADVDAHAFTPSLQRAYECSSTPGGPDPRYCHPGNQAHGTASHANAIDLLIWATDHENQYLENVRGEVPVAVFDVDTERYQRFLGASYNQRWNLLWDTPRSRRAASSATYLVNHEVGHHLGLRHGHDGYDSERQQSYGASADFFFTYLGDETASIMSYLANQREFSQFDRDNLDRWLVAARFDAANRILGEVYASPRAHAAAPDVERADALAGLAVSRLGSWDHRGASQAALDAYRAVQAAAAKAGVHIEAHSDTADVRSDGPWWTHDEVPDRGAVDNELLHARVEEAPGR